MRPNSSTGKTGRPGKLQQEWQEDTAVRRCNENFGNWHRGQRKYKVKLHSDVLEVKYVLKYFAVLEPVLSHFVCVAAWNSKEVMTAVPQLFSF